MSNIDYELAKQLKDAGFPQNGNGLWWMNSKKYTNRLPEPFETKKKAYIPTLSELIEACKPQLYSLHWDNAQEGGEIWFATLHYDYRKFIPNDNCRSGKIPEEAVANLWLALNKHK